VQAVTPKTSAGIARKALRWEEHKERTRRDLLASARKPEALTASPESFPM
jgi:hypothetical protein